MIKTNRTIKIYAKEMSTKDGKRTFLVYSFKNVDGEYFDVKLSKDVTTKPNGVGYWDINVTKYFVKDNGDYNRIFYICGADACERSKNPAEENVLDRLPAVNYSEVF